MKIFLTLGLFLALVAAKKECSVSFRFMRVCKFFVEDCYGRERECTPYKIARNKINCPVVTCVRILKTQDSKTHFKMCFIREAFCQCCKFFIESLSLTTCQSQKACVKHVYPKLNFICQKCQNCLNDCCDLKLPIKWVQKTNIYINGFSVCNNQIRMHLFKESKY